MVGVVSLLLYTCNVHKRVWEYSSQVICAAIAHSFIM
jgi:hypothetical protein